MTMPNKEGPARPGMLDLGSRAGVSDHKADAHQLDGVEKPGH